MDTGRHENYVYFNGYEGEAELVVSIKSNSSETFHIWEGYIDDIFSGAPFCDDGWKGLTRDYQEMRGPFSENGLYEVTDAKEYYEDLITYENADFDYPESAEVLNVLRELFQYAAKTDSTILIEIR